MKNSFCVTTLMLISAISIFFLQNIAGQTNLYTPFRTYAIQSYNNNLIASDTAFRNNLTSLEDSINNFLLYGSITPKVVPVVFHILQSPGMPYISNSTILRQLDQLNYDFNQSSFLDLTSSLCHTEFGILAMIPQISFCLADTMDGNSIAGNVIRTQVTAPLFEIADQMKSKVSGGSDPILPEKCLNIWICNLPDSIAGFSQMPGGPLMSDGIVISYKYLMPPAHLINFSGYQKGKTLTHLVGNYLGLYELWNEKNRCYDDYVNDTPVHNEPNFGFPISYCHSTTCFMYVKEMVVNFMDNAMDSMAFIFTKGQVYRMHAVLSSQAYRGDLCHDSALCNDQIISVGDTIPDPIIPPTKNLFSVYPNPTKGKFYVDIEIMEEESVYFYLFDVTGKLIRQEVWDEPNTIYSKEVEVPALRQGLYYISVSTTRDFMVHPIVILN